MEETLESFGNRCKIRRLMNTYTYNPYLKHDLLSSLPDPLLIEIISCLPIESAAATSTLSHRWRHLWTQITTLHFTGLQLSAIHNILTQLTSPKIRALLIPAANPDNGFLTTSITSCFSHVRDRNVEIIEVNTGSSLIKVPAWVFYCQSLVVLDLCGEVEYEVPDFEIIPSINLPNLKTLDLRIDHKCSRFLGTLFKSCPSLEVLSIELLSSLEDAEHLVDICAPNLKLLKIVMDDGGPLRFQFVINAPRLSNLDIEDYFSCSRYYFVELPVRLLEAYIVLQDLELDGEDGVAAEVVVPSLVRAICSVHYLHIYNCNKLIGYLSHVDDGSLPIFRNLSRLKATFFRGSGCWKDLLLTLRFFPNLEDVVVSGYSTEGLDWTALEPLPARLLIKLKKIEVGKLSAIDSDIELLKYILSNASFLQQLRVNVKIDNEPNETLLWKEYKFCDTLFKLPRRSLTCDIEFYGTYMNANSRCFGNGYLDCRLRSY